LKLGWLRRTDLSQARRVVTANHAAEHQDNSENQQNMDEPAHGVRRYEPGDPEPNKEKSYQKHFRSFQINRNKSFERVETDHSLKVIE
jgi:hypothetical protein